MDGKRMSTPESGGTGRGGRIAIWVAGITAALLVGGTAGLCIYTSQYEAIFPGVSVAGKDLSGQSVTQAETILLAEFPSRVGQEQVTISADGEDLGAFTLAQLGANADALQAAQDAFAVGREPGIWGFFKNGFTMLRGLMGSQTDLELALQFDENALAAATEALAQSFYRDPINGSYALSREGLWATKHRNGRQLDQTALAQALTEDGAERVEAPFEVIAAVPLDVEAMAQELDRQASPARYDILTGQVVDGQVGVSLDLEKVRATLDAAEGGATVELPADITYPSMTAQELEAVLFRDLLSSCTTDVTGTSTRRNNVKLSGESVNGTVLNHEDVFDYNAVVGQRTVEKGYGEAATYINGETVNTVGGGICQTSSTVYKAALLANLEIVERSAHRFYPGYIDLGMDATVSWGGPEFRFKNDTGYPIRIDVTYANHQITVDIYGTKTDDTYVKMTRDVLSTTGYETEYVETEELPWGEQRVEQTPYTGYEVVSYRNVYDGEDNLISSTVEAKSNYKNRNKIVLVGIAGKPAENPEPPPVEEEPSLPPEEGAVGDGQIPVDLQPPGWLAP